MPGNQLWSTLNKSTKMSFLAVELGGIFDKFCMFRLCEQLAYENKLAILLLVLLILLDNGFTLHDSILGNQVIIILIQMSSDSKQRELINQKKSQLLSELKQKKSQYMRQIQHYELSASQIHSKIVRECAELKSTTTRLKEKAEEFIKNCVNSLDVESLDKEMINIKQLATYLKSQKELLLKLSAQQSTKKPKDFDIHCLLSKSKFQQTLMRLKKIQLQQEIKFLQSNVLVKNNLVYNAAASSLIPLSQEKEINNRLDSLINQLERVITLSISCVAHEDQSKKVTGLEKQTARLKQCQTLLLSEYEKLGKLIKYFESECPNIPSNFVSNWRKKAFPAEQHQNKVWQHKRVLQSQLDSVNQFQIPNSTLVGKFLHAFDDCQEQIDLVRKKFKQYEHLNH